ncbi:PREDICTED: uncharacterized protein LOC109126515 [Camelina sativa]|uniref:Uncharacterized protein LOC109126515 n=1 Tax=Camelina sativa TaxID=90675 RepID=A0ABM1QG01_CAMSA|nr:PREDICTED: uncharacterized protein LOC109126515 [Camelina sativa]
MKDKCWIFHPHLKPAKFKANLSKEVTSDKRIGSSKQGDEAAMTASYGEVVRKSDLEALIRSIASLKDSGITFFASNPSSSLVVDSGASHHMISNPSLLDNIKPALGSVIIANGDRIPVKGVGNLKLFDKTSKAFFMPTFTSNLLSVLRSDNGGEYTSHKFKEHLTKHGILQQTTCPYKSQQNGVAERKNRHLMEVARSMMFHTNVTKRFWGDAVMTACYLINRTPTRVLNDLSPFECLESKEVNSMLRAPSVCSSVTPQLKRAICYEPTTSRLFVSRDVKFMENAGYFDKKDWNSLKDLSSSPNDRASSLRFLLDHLGNPPPKPIRDQSTSPLTNGDEESPIPTKHSDAPGSNAPHEATKTVCASGGKAT